MENFKEQLDELRAKIVKAICTLLKNNGITEMKIPDNREPIWVLNDDLFDEPRKCQLNYITASEDSLTLTMSDDDSIFVETVYDLNTKNLISLYEILEGLRRILTKKEFAIIRSNGENCLCIKQNKIYANVSNPMLNFTEGKDEFEIVPSDPTYLNKVYEYEGEQVYIRLKTYNNGWPAILLVPVESKENYNVISVNIEDTDAMGVPNRTFIDVNNESNALKFLLDNKLATDTGYSRMSYPMVNLNLPLFYQHDPESFKDINF